MSHAKEILSNHGAVHISKIVPTEFCQFFTHVLLRQSDLDRQGDKQVPNALALMHHEVMFETLHERLWPAIEAVAGEELIPTYAYARLYSNGDALERHIDRPACEVSVTIQLGRSHHYSWPIYMGGQRFDMGEGDGIVYLGNQVEHWRDACQGPPGYYSGQVFLHFVRAAGDYSSEAGDKSVRGNATYCRNRTYIMEAK